jgi:hypothetical protein
LRGGKKKLTTTQGISPYFFTEEKVVQLLEEELSPSLPGLASTTEIHYYGTGMGNPVNVRMLKKSLKHVFSNASIEINDDMLAQPGH